MSRAEIDRLIEAVFRHGAYQTEGRRAIERLAAIGDPAIDAMRDALQDPPPSDLHPKDLWESIQAFFSAVARTLPGRILDLLSTGENPITLYWALGEAEDRRSLDALIAGLRHEDKYARWAAAESLVRRGDSRAVPALIGALKDRSDMVKTTVVQAMQTDGRYRRPEAIPLLERIVANKSIRKHGPGLWATAGAVLERIRTGGGEPPGLPGA